MTYLLSLVTARAASPAKESSKILCYYINDTSYSQIIRAMSGVGCHFERVVFSRERILFEAFPESYLEVYSCLSNGTRLTKIDCGLLHINSQSNL
ncbi:DUF1830 domain-containing protein [Neosynechococcus sphagnicola]|uniref:DUF1830 domain-containing protein n=1 Tax=Neosynechococcus sphagnicola TaxID=1501145 RepID=UPI0009077CD4